MRWILLIILCICWTVAWANSGRLAYIADGALWVRALPDGAPRAVAHGTIDSPSWSPSGNWLSYETDSARHILLVRSDGKSMPTPKVMTGASWSPVADLLAYTTARGGLFLFDGKKGTTHTLVSEGTMNRDGNDLHLPLPADADNYPEAITWAPDGRTMAFSTIYGGLFLCNTRTHALKTIHRSVSSRYIDHMDWSDNGRRLAYVTVWMNQDGDHHANLWRINADSTNRRLLLDPGREAYRPWLSGWTPDGRSLLFYLNQSFGVSGMGDGAPLMVISEQGGTPRKVASVTPVTRPPIFSSRGHMAALIDSHGRETWYGRRLAIIRLPHRESVLSPHGVNVTGAAWSPDGKILACEVAPERRIPEEDLAVLARRRIVLTPPGRWRPRRLRAGSQYREEHPEWSRDGRHLLIVRIDKDHRAALWLVSADGASARQVTQSLQTLDWDESDGWFGWYGLVNWDMHYAWWQRP